VGNATFRGTVFSKLAQQIQMLAHTNANRSKRRGNISCCIAYSSADLLV